MHKFAIFLLTIASLVLFACSNNFSLHKRALALQYIDGRSKLERGEAEKALEIYNRILAEIPPDSRLRNALLLDRGHALLRLQRFEESVEGVEGLQLASDADIRFSAQQVKFVALFELLGSGNKKLTRQEMANLSLLASPFVGDEEHVSEGVRTRILALRQRDG